MSESDSSESDVSSSKRPRRSKVVLEKKSAVLSIELFKELRKLTVARNELIRLSVLEHLLEVHLKRNGNLDILSTEDATVTTTQEDSRKESKQDNSHRSPQASQQPLRRSGRIIPKQDSSGKSLLK